MSKKKVIFLALGIIFALGILILFWGQPKKEVIEDPTLKKIKTRGTIIVGTDATYPPMESIDEAGNFVGFDIDLAKEIAFDLGVKVEFKNIPWEELISFAPLEREEVDLLISSITITPERAEKVAFSDPYFNAGQVIVTTVEKAAEIKGPENLAGKKVGVQIDTTSEKIAKRYTEEVLVMAFDNYELALKELLAKNIDAIVIDYPAALSMVASQKESLKIVGEPFTQEFYGIALRKKDSLLLAKVNNTIKRLKMENTLEKLIEKWFTK